MGSGSIHDPPIIRDLAWNRTEAAGHAGIANQARRAPHPSRTRDRVERSRTARDAGARRDARRGLVRRIGPGRNLARHLERLGHGPDRYGCQRASRGHPGWTAQSQGALQLGFIPAQLPELFDADRIDRKYRRYVLLAIYTRLLPAYPDGYFRPKQPLSWGEASQATLKLNQAAGGQRPR